MVYRDFRPIVRTTFAYEMVVVFAVHACGAVVDEMLFRNPQ